MRVGARRRSHRHRSPNKKEKAYKIRRFFRFLESESTSLRGSLPQPSLRKISRSIVCTRRHSLSRPTGIAKKLCKYYRTTASAWSRSRLQDLLHHGMACRKDTAASVDIDASRDIQRHDQRYRIWQHGSFELSRHVRHGQAYGFGVALHVGGRGAVPTGSHGTTTATRSRFGPVQSISSASGIRCRFYYGPHGDSGVLVRSCRYRCTRRPSPA